MPITDPQAIRFVNEVVRPLCEQKRQYMANVAAARASYDAMIGTFFYGHDNEAIVDGRDAEGVSRLTGSDVLAWVAQALYAEKTAYDASGVANTYGKPCVRSLLF